MCRALRLFPVAAVLCVGVDPVSWTLHSLREEVTMGKVRSPYPAEFKRQMVELVSGRENTRRAVAGIRADGAVDSHLGQAVRERFRGAA